MKEIGLRKEREERTPWNQKCSFKGVFTLSGGERESDTVSNRYKDIATSLSNQTNVERVKICGIRIQITANDYRGGSMISLRGKRQPLTYYSSKLSRKLHENEEIRGGVG